MMYQGGKGLKYLTPNIFGFNKYTMKNYKKKNRSFFRACHYVSIIQIILMIRVLFTKLPAKDI